MKLDLFQKIGIGLGTILILYILTSTLIKKEVAFENTKFVEGELQSFEKFKLKNKWSISYNIKLRGDETEYKIIPEYFNCFDRSSFYSNVSNGQIIKLGIDQDNGLKSSSVKSVVLIETNGVEYIDNACVNEKINQDKKTLPLIILGHLGLLTLIYLGSRYCIYRK